MDGYRVDGRMMGDGWMMDDGWIWGGWKDDG